MVLVGLMTALVILASTPPLIEKIAGPEVARKE